MNGMPASEGCSFHRHRSRHEVPMTRGAADANDNDPDRGHFCIARWSRHEVPKTPGCLCSFLKKVDSVSVTLLLILLNVDF